MKRDETIRSVVTVVIAIALALVSGIPASAVAEEVGSDAVELEVVPMDDEAAIEFIPIRAVVSWDPAEIEVEFVPGSRQSVRPVPVRPVRFDPFPAVPPTAPCAVILVPPLSERVRRYPARFSVHPVCLAQR